MGKSVNPYYAYSFNIFLKNLGDILSEQGLSFPMRKPLFLNLLCIEKSGRGSSFFYYTPDLSSCFYNTPYLISELHLFLYYSFLFLFSGLTHSLLSLCLLHKFHLLSHSYPRIQVSQHVSHCYFFCGLTFLSTLRHIQKLHELHQLLDERERIKIAKQREYD